MGSPSKTLRHYYGLPPTGSPNNGHAVRAYTPTQIPGFASHFAYPRTMSETTLSVYSNQFSTNYIIWV